MNDIKKKPASKPSKAKAVSPAQEKPISDFPAPRTGVSPLGVVFLSLLTIAAVVSGSFAFRDKLLPHLHQYLALPAPAAPTALTGFVPVPATNKVPTLESTAPQFDELRQQQTAFETRLVELQEQIANAPTATAMHPGNTDQSNELKEALLKTETQLNTSLEKISTLEAQLANLQKWTAELADNADKTAAPVNIKGLVAFQTLQTQALSGKPFQESLQRMVALLEDTSTIEPTISKLEQLAKAGRPSLSHLQKTFAQAVSAYMQSGTQENNSFMGKVKHNLSSFVRVRRTDGSGNNNDIIITSAEKALAEGNVKASYSELLKLEGSAKEAFNEWLTQARHYYQLPESLTALQLELANSLEASK